MNKAVAKESEIFCGKDIKPMTGYGANVYFQQ